MACLGKTVPLSNKQHLKGKLMHLKISVYVLIQIKIIL